MAHKTVCRPRGCFALCAFTVCLGDWPRTDVDKARMHTSSMKKEFQKRNGIKPVYIAAECFPSCLCSFLNTSSHASRCLTFFSLRLCVLHTRSGKQRKQPCYCGTCAHNVLAAAQFQEWHYTFLEMDPNWIKLCCSADMRCRMTWTGSGRDQSEDGDTVL